MQSAVQIRNSDQSTHIKACRSEKGGRTEETGEMDGGEEGEGIRGLGRPGMERQEEWEK